MANTTKRRISEVMGITMPPWLYKEVVNIKEREGLRAWQLLAVGLAVYKKDPAQFIALLRSITEAAGGGREDA